MTEGRTALLLATIVVVCAVFVDAMVAVLAPAARRAPFDVSGVYHPTVIYRHNVDPRALICAEVPRDKTQPLCVTVGDLRVLVQEKGFAQAAADAGEATWTTARNGSGRSTGR